MAITLATNVSALVMSARMILSISAPADRMDDAWLGKLKQTAQQISAALGHEQGS